MADQIEAAGLFDDKPKKPAAAAQATPTEPKDTDEEPTAEPTVPTKPAKAENWKSLRESRDEFRTKAEAFEKELSALKALPKTAANTEELEALKKERDDYSEKLRLIAVEKHPKFEAHFNGRINGILESAKNLIGGENGQALADLLKLPDSEYKNSQLETAISNIGAVKGAKLGALMVQLDQISSERSAEVAKAKDTFESMVKGERDKETARQASVTQTFEETLKKAQDPKDGLFVFQKRDGDDAWNKRVEEMTSSARNIFSGKLPMPDVARASMWAAAAPTLLEHSVEQAKKIAAYEKQISEMSAATPKPGSGGDSKEPVKIFGNSVDTIVAMAESNGFVTKGR